MYVCMYVCVGIVLMQGPHEPLFRDLYGTARRNNTAYRLSDIPGVHDAKSMCWLHESFGAASVRISEFKASGTARLPGIRATGTEFLMALSCWQERE